MIYAALVDGRDEDGRLAIDAALGDKTAGAEIDRRRLESAAAADFEIG